MSTDSMTHDRAAGLSASEAVPSIPQPLDTEAPRSRARLWLARLGFAGFMFFLIKGLLWLIVPAVIVVMTRGGAGGES